MSTTKRRTTTKKAEKPKKAAAKKPAASREDADEVVEKPAKSARAKAGKAKAEAPPAPKVTSGYSLDRPSPPEAAGLPKKVGALLGIAQEVLHINSFRPGQAEAFEHLLAGEDLLAVMPTGSGKSLLYQLTSLVVPGVTVVVSPLIALIKDQLD
jgi:superfamily II DNA helicase RecQ